MSRSFMHILGSAAPSLGTAVRAGDIVAALAPPANSPGATAITKAPPHKSALEVAKEVAKDEAFPVLVGGGAGWLLFRKSGHPILGALAGHAVASVARPLITGKDRKRALCQLAVEGAGVVGALVWKKHPVLGWVLGLGAGFVATALVKDSAAHEMFQKWKG